MNLAQPMQQFQDWFTQQWVILWGTKIDPHDFPWLMGPFGNQNGIGEEFIFQLAEKENLIMQRDVKSQGLIPSIDQLDLSEIERSNLSKQVIDFYEKTSDYSLDLIVKWSPFFKFWGVLVNRLFSNRINQLNVPFENDANVKSLKSEIITLLDPKTDKIKHTIWLRTSTANNKVMYSGIYGTCTLPSGTSCIKAVFPLPHGNATVIMTPSVGERGELVLESCGKKIGDAGFYFLLKDSKGKYWSQFIASFRDKLVVKAVGGNITAEQTLSLWNRTVVQLTYKIEKK